MKLEKVVPWGRSLAEYIRMFDLTPDDLERNILDCAAGPASFNAELTRQGGCVISCDPIYQFSASAIADRIEAAYPIVMAATTANADRFVWRDIASPEQLGRVRMAAMQEFLADFSTGLLAKRYLNCELPGLPFTTCQFDLALCSHLLFTYSDQLSLAFHLASIVELCRVAIEVRIFPLLVNMTGEVSPFLQAATETLSQQYDVQIKPVRYEFQRGGNQMMQIKQRVSSAL